MGFEYLTPVAGEASGSVATHEADTSVHGVADTTALATSASVTSAVSTHAGLSDPHPGYVLESLLDAKGDLVVASAADTPARVAAGSDGQILVADSAQAAGVRWSDLANPVPADHGLLAWSYDIAQAVNTAAPSGGVIYMTKVRLISAQTITNVCANTGANGSILANCFAGLYDTGGNRLALTADQSTPWATAGNQIMALTAPYAAAAGTYFVALLMGSGSLLTFNRSSGAGAVGNFNLAAAAYRFAQSGSSQTSLPTSITMGSRTQSSNAFWVGLS